MKYIQSICVVLLMISGLVACSANEDVETSGNNSTLEGMLRFLPVAPPTYANSTRISTDGTSWNEGDVVFVHVILFADEAMSKEISAVYTALRCDEVGSWTSATGTTDSNVEADFTFKTVDAGANADLWSTKNDILWPLVGVKAAVVQAIYAGQQPEVELLNGGAARIRIHTQKVGYSEIMTSTCNLMQTDISTPVKLAFLHRLTRLDFGKTLEQDIQIVSGSSGSGVNIIPISVDFSGILTAYNKATIPANQRYVYLMPDEMVKNDADRIFRFQETTSGNSIATFSLPQIPEGQSGVSYYYGRSYSLAPQSGGEVTPDNMFPLNSH